MSQRAVQFVSAIFAGLLLGAPLVTASHGAPTEAEKCLSGPKGAPPAGGHWYYRTDRATKRRCWFIGDAKEKRSRAAPETSPTAADSVSPPNSTGTQLSIADARAELPLPTARRAPEATARTGQPAAEAANPTGSRLINAEEAGAERSVVASRWFEPTSMVRSAPPQPPAGSSADQPLASSEAAPPTAPATFRLAAADAPVASPSGSVRQLLIAIVGALSLAGLLASAIFRLGGARWTGRRRNEIRVNRGVNWDLAENSRPSLPDVADGVVSRDSARLAEAGLARDPRPAGDPDQRIAQMLARSAAT